MSQVTSSARPSVLVHSDAQLKDLEGGELNYTDVEVASSGRACCLCALSYSLPSKAHVEGKCQGKIGSAPAKGRRLTQSLLVARK